MEAIYMGAMAGITRWLRATVLVTCIRGRMGALFMQRAGSTLRPSGARRLPPVGQQLLDSAVHLGGQPGEHVLEVDPRVMAAELDRLQQAHHDRSALAGQLAAYEQPIFSTNTPGPNLVFDMVMPTPGLCRFVG